MRNAPIVGTTEFGSASFRKDSPTDVTIKVAYRTDEQRVELEGDDLPSAVAALCEAEIEHTRKALMDLGESLARELHDVGDRPVINRQWQDRDSRTFHRNGALTVEVSEYRSEESLSIGGNISEAAIAREIVGQMIEQRIRGIQNVYRNALVSLPKQQNARN